jgi:hypothetical protein
MSKGRNRKAGFQLTREQREANLRAQGVSEEKIAAVIKAEYDSGTKQSPTEREPRDFTVADNIDDAEEAEQVAEEEVELQPVSEAQPEPEAKPKKAGTRPLNLDVAIDGNTTRRLSADIIKADNAKVLRDAAEYKSQWQIAKEKAEDGENWIKLIDFERECREEGIPLGRFIKGFGGDRALSEPLFEGFRIYWFGRYRYFKMDAAMRERAKAWLRNTQ